MTGCWSEGNLRAYLDGELSPNEMKELTAHLRECAGCEALRSQLAGRAAWVGELLGTLPESRHVVRIPARPRPTRLWPRWAAAAAVLVAGLTLAVGLIMRRGEPRPSLLVPERQSVGVRVPAVETTSGPQLVAKHVAPKRVRLQKPRQVFLSLDDDPIETGVVLRVALGPTEIPADVVFGADGLPHAIRLVGNQ